MIGWDLKWVDNFYKTIIYFTCAVDGESKRKQSKYVKGVTDTANKIMVIKQGRNASSIKDSFWKICMHNKQIP